MMRLRTRFLAILWVGIYLGVVGGCARAPVGTPSSHLPLAKATPIPQPGNGCFERIEVVPGETTKDEIVALWGEPSFVWYGGVWEYVGPQRGTLVYFSGSQVESIRQPVFHCTIADIFGTLGPPETVEIITQNGQPGPPVYPIKLLHYPSQGVAFGSPCPFALEWRGCSSFRPTGEVEERWLYLPTTEEAIISSRTDVYRTFIEWSGFDE